jgi:hypothetical protein
VQPKGERQEGRTLQAVYGAGKGGLGWCCVGRVRRGVGCGEMGVRCGEMGVGCGEMGAGCG